MADIRVGDVGTELVAIIVDEDDTVVDVSSASSLVMLLDDPRGNTSTKTAVFDTDGTNGKIKYVTVSGDLDEAGEWKYQGRVTLSGSTWSGEIHTFCVAANLDTGD